jgi:hypothetical protein
MLSFGELIDECRENFGPPPRDLTPREARDFKLQASLSMRWYFFRTGDKLKLILDDQALLRDQGRVVWGALVQANNVLFDPDNRMTLPANAIYSTERYFDDRVDELRRLGRELFDLKGTRPRDPELTRFANIVTSETRRVMKKQIPPEYCDDRKVYFTTLLIQPSHLPDGYLAEGFFPLVICPGETPATMILPAHYWPKGLRRIWADNGRG